MNAFFILLIIKREHKKIKKIFDIDFWQDLLYNSQANFIRDLLQFGKDVKMFRLKGVACFYII